MSEKYRNRYRIPSARLQTWDYGNNGWYYITICTHNKNHFFGAIINGQMHINPIGEIALQFWFEIPKHFDFVILDEFIIMPDHIHCILVIDKSVGGFQNGDVETRQCLVSTDSKNTPGKSRFQNQGKHTISSIIGSYKSIVSKHARKTNPLFKWQSGFYDHIIHSYNSLLQIQNYIKSNPENWEK